MKQENNTGPAIILIGCPNVGKSTIFRKLCGKYARADNQKDSFLEISYGKVALTEKSMRVIDIPGINSLFGDSEEELIIKKLLVKEKEAIIIFVIDAKNLRRDLILGCELLEFEKPMVVVLNMMDEALQKGMIIDEKEIRKNLGVDVIMTIGNEGEGINELRKYLINPRVSEYYTSYPDYIENGITQIQNLPHKNGYLNRALALQLLFAHNGMFENINSKYLGIKERAQINRIRENVKNNHDNNIQYEVLNRRVMRAIDIENKSVNLLTVKKNLFRDKFGNYACHPVYGVPILLLVMVLLYLFVGRFGAEILADYFQISLIGGIIIPIVESLLSNIPSDFIHDLFLGTYGLISMGLMAGIGIVFPIICTFYLAFGILEDSGYLTRVGILLNSLFNKMGLNGKAVLPLFLGFSCVTMASLSVRALDTKKERIIAILLLWLCIPCSAQLSIFAAIMASVSIKAVFIIVGVVLFQMVLVGFAAAKLLPGKKSDLLMEIYPIRLPNIKYAITKTFRRISSFFKEVIPLFLVASFILLILDKTKVLQYIEMAGKPIATGLLGLPPRITEVFMLGFIRREAGAAFFKTIADVEMLSEIQIIVAMVVMTLFIPCFTSILVVTKEYGIKTAVGISAFVLGYALLIGIILNKILLMIY